MTEPLYTGPQRCQLCNQPVTVLYDRKADWAYAKECMHTVPPRHLRLTAQERANLISLKNVRYLIDGFAPRPHRTPQEMGHE